MHPLPRHRKPGDHDPSLLLVVVELRGVDMPDPSFRRHFASLGRVFLGLSGIGLGIEVIRDLLSDRGPRY